jgi:hypothetical protein
MKLVLRGEMAGKTSVGLRYCIRALKLETKLKSEP